MRALAKVHARPSGDMVVASIDGEIDLTNASQLGHDLFEMVPHTAEGLIIDFTRTNYLDSRGVQLLFDLTQRLRMRRQTISLVVPQASVLRRLLDILAISSIMPIHPSVESAMDDSSRT